MDTEIEQNLSTRIIVDEVGYGEDEKPLHHSIEYHPGSHMQFGLIRLLESAWVVPSLNITQRAMQMLDRRINLQKGG